MSNTPTDDGELRKQLLLLKDEDGRFLMSAIGVTTPVTLHVLMDYIHQYGNTRAVEARIELHRELSHPHSKSWQNQLYNLDLERLSALTQPQKENK